MLEYSAIGFFVGVNLLLYGLVSIPLDLATYKSPEISRRTSNDVKTLFDVFIILSYSSTFLTWVIFVGIPMESFIGSNILYNPQLSRLEPLGIILQLLGCSLLFCGTFID